VTPGTGVLAQSLGHPPRRVHSLGDPAEVMSLDEVDEPTPGEGQLLVRVRAAGLNFPDVLMARGQYQERPPLPFTPGVELCGEVAGTGRRVLGSPAGGPGAFAEYALMDAAAAFPVPDAMSDEQAAALYLTYQTGYVGLHRRAALQPGE
jgi:NADPH2:quinone reductase